MKYETRYVHTNIVAKAWKPLAQFYVTALGCTRKPPKRNLKGRWLDEATALKDAHIEGIHLRLPGYGADGPTLEIFQYSRETRGTRSAVNRPGLAHIAFAVKDVDRALRKIEKYGGSRVGSIVSTRISGMGSILFVYARDPEGNIIELQKWE